MKKEKKTFNKKASKKKDTGILSRSDKNLPFKKVFTFFLSFVFYFFSGLFLIILSLAWLNSAGFIKPGSLLYGFDYVPVNMLVYVLIPAFLVGMFTKRKAFSTGMLVLYIFFWLACGDHSLFGSPGKKSRAVAGNDTISVMTLNVAQFYPGIKWVGLQVEKIYPEVLCFQEHENFGPLNYEYVRNAFPSYHVAIGQGCDSGIMSVHPIIAFKEVELSSRLPVYHDNTPEKLTNRPHRRFLHAIIKKNGRLIHILNLRLIAGRGKNFFDSPRDVIAWGRYLVNTQSREVREMADYIASLKGPVIFAGDFNAPPNASVLKPLYKQGKDVLKEFYTFPPCTFEAKMPLQRLDYIFYSGGLEPIYAKVLPYEISDHLPVYAVFKIVSM